MDNTHSQICICGIGPGNPDYILPVVYEKVKQANVLIGGQRQLDIFPTNDKNKCVFNGKLDKLKQCINLYKNLNIVVLVSGDTGFHSLRRFLKQEYPEMDIEVIPGISSFQYMYARLGLGYENAWLDSVHGTEINFIEKVKKYPSVFLLTDKKNNYKSIAHKLINNNLDELTMHIGSNLSYPDEKVISCKAKEVIDLNDALGMCSVIIENNKNEG